MTSTPIRPGSGLDQLFAALSDARRRSVLRLLTESTDEYTVVGLARAVRAAERRRSADATVKSTERLTVALHHVHLPRLDEAGLIDYDRCEGTVHPVAPSGDDRVDLSRTLLASLGRDGTDAEGPAGPDEDAGATAGSESGPAAASEERRRAGGPFDG